MRAGLILALALAPLLGTRAEVLHVLEDFSDAQRFFTDAGASLGPGFFDSGAMNATTTAEGALRVDYDVYWKDLYGYVQFGRILDDYYPCTDATYLSLRYRVNQPQTPARAARMGVVLLDGSNCAEGPACSALAAPGWTFENYITFEFVLDDTSGAWQTLKIGLCGENEDPTKPFMRLTSIGPVGNGKLDTAKLRGFRVNFVVDTDETSRGSIEFDDLSCIVPDEPVDPCAAPPRPDAAKVNDVVLDATKAYRTVEFGHRTCDDICAEDSNCLYYQVEYPYLPFGTIPQLPSCHLFSEATTVRPATTREAQDIEVYWRTDEKARGNLCEVCSCDDEAVADCHGADLATVPAVAPGDYVRELDLRGNPRLALIGPQAFEGYASLEILHLPASVTSLQPEAIPQSLRKVELEASAAPLARNFVPADDLQEAFGDVCCGLGLAAGGLRFCEWQPDRPGVADVTVEPGAEFFDITSGDVESITRESEVFAEAASSLAKCGYYCSVVAGCVAYTYRDDDVTIFTGSNCFLFYRLEDIVASEATPSTFQFTSGLPPSTRAELRNAHVVATPETLEANEANGYTTRFDVSLGATPLRGAVWITIQSHPSVEIEPKRVVLYDNATSVTVTLRVIDAVTKDAGWPVVLIPTSCDAAFELDETVIQLDVVTPAQSRGSRDQAHRKYKKRLETGFIIVGCLAGVLALIWFAVAATRFARKKTALENDRAMHVRQQVASAMQQVEEFQAAYATLPGDRFVDLKRLKPHETLRDENLLIVYDSLESVRAAMRRDLTFVFVSHQWLAFNQPDPHGVHFASIQQAIRNVADENELPLSSIRVWVDIFSIPQKNRSEQRLAIASLPTFASACNYFVVVAPNTKHLDTGCDCNSKTYRMFVSTNRGLRSLADNEQVLLEALDVMDGDLTCCRLGHARGEPCDREELMLPMLGLYTEIYRGRHGERAQTYAFVEPMKDKLYPRSFTYTYKDADGVEHSEESVLFGDLLKAAEIAVDLSVANPDDPLWRSGLPDLAPGTDAPQRSHHIKAHHHHAASAKSRSADLKRGLSTVVVPSRCHDMRMPAPRRRSTNSEDDALPAPPDRGGRPQLRPQLLRSMTWRASAPQLPGLDDSEDESADGSNV